MPSSPISSMVLFHLGPIAITRPVLTTWFIMLVLTLGSLMVTRRLKQQQTGVKPRSRPS